MYIEVEPKHVYGVLRIYPVCDKAKIFTALTRSKTLLDTDISLIKQLGYKIKVRHTDF